MHGHSVQKYVVEHQTTIFYLHFSCHSVNVTGGSEMTEGNFLVSGF